MYDVNRCIQDGYMVLEIATGLSPLAMTAGDGGWFLCAGSLAVIDGVFCGTVITVPYKAFVPIRRAGTSDWSGGFCSPYGKQNLSGTSLSAATRCRKRAAPYGAAQVLRD